MGMEAFCGALQEMWVSTADGSDAWVCLSCPFAFTLFTLFFFFLQTHFQLVNLFKAFGLQVWWIFGS